MATPAPCRAVLTKPRRLAREERLCVNFASKQQLRVATVKEAGRILREELVQPALPLLRSPARLVAGYETFFGQLQTGLQLCQLKTVCVPFVAATSGVVHESFGHASGDDFAPAVERLPTGNDQTGASGDPSCLATCIRDSAVAQRHWTRASSLDQACSARKCGASAQDRLRSAGQSRRPLPYLS